MGLFKKKEKETFYEDEEELDRDIPVVDQLRKIQKERNKRERFIKTRMWFSTFISKLYPDRVTIPPNIGNNIFVGNNQIVTKNSISSMMVLREMSDETPIALTSKLVREVKSQVPGVYVDFIIKNSNYFPDLAASGLKSRIRQWMFTLDNENASDRVKARAARLLYTVDVARSQEKLFKSQIYFIVRAQNGLQLKQAMKVLEGKVAEYKIDFKTIKSKALDHLNYTSLLSSKSGEYVRDIPYNITSATVLAELLPTIQGLNDDKGNYLGLDLKNHSPYHINFRATAKGKNIYVVGLSGFGKTFLVINWCIDGYAIGYNVCIVDMKGNEFTSFARATNGYTVSLRQESRGFINTFVMDKDAVGEDGPIVYYNQNMMYSKMLLRFAARVEKRYESQCDVIIDEFLKALYASRGVLRENLNTWYRTKTIHPLDIYKEFNKFLSKELIKSYPNVAEHMLERFKTYFDRSGSNSHMFLEEFQMDEILKARVLHFDFGLLNSSGVVDEAMLDMRTMFMRIMNNEFVRYKKSIGEWTIKILEESQIATPYMIQMYGEEMSLRRAQQQVTVLLGNSVTTLANNPHASNMMENINILVMGVLHKNSREYLINEFGLDKHRNTLKAIAEDPDYENKFLLVNKMQKNATSALIKAYVPNHIAKKKIFTVVETEDS